jgi:hypothetical protein
MTAPIDEPHIGLVVEGEGEIPAVPLLLRKWLQQRGDFRDLLGKPIPCYGRDKALRPKGVEGKVATAAARPGCRAVLVLLDGEGDPVCRLGPKLLKRASGVTGIPVEVCLADPNYEAWFLASSETLGLPELSFGMRNNPAAAVKAALLPSKYVKPTWQPRLTDRMDIELARSRDSSLARALSKFDDLVALI